MYISIQLYRLDRNMITAPRPANTARAFLSGREAAARYSVHQQTISRWAALGQMPAPVRIGTRVRWRLEELEKWENGFAKAQGEQ